MFKTLINYQIYILIGILMFPIFAFIFYIVKSLIERAKFIKTLDSIKKPLLERINRIDTAYKIYDKKEEISNILQDIKKDIHILKQEIGINQQKKELQQLYNIEKEVNSFYQTIQKNTIEKKLPNNQIIYKKNIQQQSQESPIIKEQIRIMNENIEKFITVYREKDKIIEERNKIIAEKNTSIHILQKKLIETEEKLKTLIKEYQQEKNKTKAMEEKDTIIKDLQKKLNTIERKFKEISIYYQNIMKQIQIKDKIIEEKNLFIENLQKKLNDIENKLEDMVFEPQQKKDPILEEKLENLQKKIQRAKRKNILLIILLNIFLGIGIIGFLIIYRYYNKPS